MEEKVLERLGLSRLEAKVYLALLALGESSVIEISRKGKLERTYTYKVLESLIEKGLVSFVVENESKKFKATEPDRLLHLQEEKEAALREILPKLNRISQSKKKGEPSVEIFRGTRGVRSLANEILEIKEDYYTLVEDVRNTKLDLFLAHFYKSIERENIHEIMLIKKKPHIRKSKNTILRFLPKNHPYLATTFICGDLVGIMISSDPFLAIRIKSKALAKTYKSYFDILWEVSKKE